MRNLLILLPLVTLVTSAAAEENAADLFYRAFWKEQAGGETRDAEAIYEKILKDHAKAPEAPRALLGLIRIRATGGRDVSELVARLERDYPDAEADLAQARRIVTTLTKRFTPIREDGDPPSILKLKMLYQQLIARSEIAQSDRDFITDLGVVSHPALRELLRSQDGWVVRIGAELLLEQRTPAALAVIAEALTDETALLRGVIVKATRMSAQTSPELVDALAGLSAVAGPRLRADVVKALAQMIASVEKAEREKIFALLVRALADPDATVRAAASRPYFERKYSLVPAKYVLALIERMEAGDTAIDDYAYHLLPHFAPRVVETARVEKILKGHGELKAHHLGPPQGDDESALMMLRLALHFRSEVRWQPWVQKLAQYAVKHSGEAAARLWTFAIEHEDSYAAANVLADKGSSEEHLGAEAANRLRALALERVEVAGPGQSHSPAAQYLHALGLRAEHFPIVLDVLRKHAGRGYPRPVLNPKFLEAIGPEKAAQLAEFAAGEEQFRMLVRGGSVFKREQEAELFYAGLVARMGPKEAKELKATALRSMSLRHTVAKRMLEARGAEWGWLAVDPHAAREGEQRPGRRTYGDKDAPGPDVWIRGGIRGIEREDPLRTILLDHAQDPRREISESAAHAAASLASPAGLQALERCLNSPWPGARVTALRALGRRKPEAVAEFVKRDGLTNRDRDAALSALRDAGAAPVLAALLGRRQGVWGAAWSIYYGLAPKEAVELALQEVALGEEAHGLAALGILTRTDDPRRIEVFRKVLRGELKGRLQARRLATVLDTVAAQYLIELGEETLAHLRNPDQRVRIAATAAIEKLKFYAEARKAFKDDG